MTTQTTETPKQVTARELVVGKIRQLGVLHDLYRDTPFWDCPRNQDGSYGITPEQTQERLLGYGVSPMMQRINKSSARLRARLDRMDYVANVPSYGVMDQARRLDAINEQLPEGQKLAGNESWSYGRVHVQEILGSDVANNFFSHNTWENVRGLPDNDALYQKLKRASEELRFTSRKKSAGLYELARKIAERKMGEKQYTALSNENHALWRNLTSVLQAA